MAETKPLDGKVILITGAGQGIGEATAKYLAARGAILSLSDISEATVTAVGQSIRGQYPESKAISQVVDVCNHAAVQQWVEETKKRFGQIDGCVNNAGEQLPPLYYVSLLSFLFPSSSGGILMLNKGWYIRDITAEDRADHRARAGRLAAGDGREPDGGIPVPEAPARCRGRRWQHRQCG